jgi:predicted nucleic acid-binding protein
MQQGQIVDLDPIIALGAARLSVQYGTPMADSFMLATARNHKAVFWTQDSHFDGMGNVRYIRAVPAK